MILWAAVALAGPGQLAIERSGVAIDEQRFASAREQALMAIEADDASLLGYWLYLRASEGAGLRESALHDLREVSEQNEVARALWLYEGAKQGQDGDLSDLESETGPHRDLLYAALQDDDPEQALSLLAGVPGDLARWFELTLLMGADESLAAQRASQIYKEAPGSPQVLAPLWDETSDTLKLQKLRESLLRKVAKRLPETSDPVALYRQRSLFVAARRPDLAAQASHQLESAGEGAALPRRPWDRHERTMAARAYVAEGVLTPPRGATLEYVDVLARMAEQLRVDGKLAEALALWEACEVQGHPVAATMHAEALVGLERFDDAVRQSHIAVQRAAQPGYDDLYYSDVSARSEAMARALRARSRAFRGALHFDTAHVDLTLANLLDPGRSDEMERNQSLYKLNVPSRPQDRYQKRGALAHTVALEAAREALDEGDTEAALAIAADAQLILSMKVTEIKASYAWELAEAAQLRARALVARDEPEAALAELTVAHLLRPWHPDPEVTLLRADLLERMGHREAAFATYALAASVGAEPSPERLGDTYSGLGSWESGAAGVVERFFKQAAPHRPSTDLDSFRVVRVASPVRTQRGSAAGRPLVGARMPPWGLATDKGAMSAATTQGRVLVMAFWASWCGPCKEQLPDLAELARKLRGEGKPIEILAISVDEQASAYHKARREMDMQGLVVTRDPRLGSDFGVTSVPTTFVVDRQGVARHRSVGYSGSTSALERQLLGLAR